MNHNIFMDIVDALDGNDHRNVLLHRVIAFPVFPPSATRQEGGRVSTLSFIEHQEPQHHYSTTLLDLPARETYLQTLDARGLEANIPEQEGEVIGDTAVLMSVYGSFSDVFNNLDLRLSTLNTQLSVMVEFVHVFPEVPVVPEDLRQLVYTIHDRHPYMAVPVGADYGDLEYAQGMDHYEHYGYDIAPHYPAHYPGETIGVDYDESEEELLYQRERNREAQRAALEIMAGIERSRAAIFVGDNEIRHPAPERQPSPALEGQEEYQVSMDGFMGTANVASPVAEEDVAQEVPTSSPLPGTITAASAAAATDADSARATANEVATRGGEATTETNAQEQEQRTKQSDASAQPATRSKKRTRSQTKSQPIERAAKETKRRKRGE